MASTKLTMLIDMSTKLFNNKLGQMQNKWSKSIDTMDSKFGNFMNKVPRLGGMMDKLRTPITALGIAAVGLFGTMAVKGMDSARQFDESFTPIRNLNLEKPKSELDSYRNKIRDVAFEVGTNLKESTEAIFDLQSATGIFGDDAIAIFRKVGIYSLATGANLSDAMNSTTKAMKAFGLGVDDIDKLLESNAKAAAVGITTFDDLAKVQTVFAGSASAAGQEVDTANKVFAMFTSIAKNSEIASQMTKTFFQGLGMQAENFKETLKIDVFDKNGMMRQADDILKEIGGRFKNMNDKEITEAINKIGGPEGLRGALAKVSTGAEDMISVFESFDSMSFSMSDAMKNAEGDINIMKKIFHDRLETLLSKFGEKFFPMIAKVFDKLTPVLQWLYENFDAVAIGVGALASVFGVLTVAVWANNIALLANPIGIIVAAIILLIGWVTIAVKKYDEFGAGMLALLGPVGYLISFIKTLYDHWESVKKAFETEGMIAGLKRLGQVILGSLLHPLEQLLELLSKLPESMGGAKFATAAQNIHTLREKMNVVTPPKTEDEKSNDEKKSLYDPESVFGDGATGKGTGTKSGKEKLKNEVNKVTGDARQSKNITITIDALNKGGINMNGSSTQGMSLQDVENWFNEAMMRIMRNAELS
jgi:TP901 family phage tail tape measure protein